MGSQTQVDMAGLDLVVNSVRTGATAPGATGAGLTPGAVAAAGAKAGANATSVSGPQAFDGVWPVDVNGTTIYMGYYSDND